MNTYTAQVKVQYHSGSMHTNVQVQALGITQARAMLEQLYGANNVFGVFLA